MKTFEINGGTKDTHENKQNRFNTQKGCYGIAVDHVAAIYYQVEGGKVAAKAAILLTLGICDNRAASANNGTGDCPNENCIKNVMQAVTLWGERVSIIANAVAFFVVMNIERFLLYFFGIKCFRFVFRMGS